MKNIAFVSCFGTSLHRHHERLQEVSRFSFDLGAGFTQPVGNTGRLLNDGWNVQGGVGYNFSNRIGTMMQLDYNSIGHMNGTALGTSGFPGGDIHIVSATVDPIFHLTPKSRL